MNIGIVTTWFERGAAVVSRQFMDVLLQLGHDVFIYARGGEHFAKTDPRWNLQKVTWNRFLKSNIPTDIDQQQFEQWLDSKSIDLVLFNEQHFFEPILWAKQKGIPAIAYIDYYTSATIPLFAIYDQLWCNTKRHHEAFKWHDDARYIPWGTDTELFRPSNTNKTEFFFFHSAGMNPYRKGTDIFLRALHSALPRLSTLGRKTLIHSQTKLAASLPALSKEIAELTQAGLLQVIEATIPAPGLYHKAKVYVYPSRLDGIGLTLAEAASCGLFTITTDEPPMRDFVVPGHNLLIPTDERYQRGDGYYWQMVNPSYLTLKTYLTSEITPNRNAIRDYAVNHFNFFSNTRCLSQIISELNPKQKHRDESLTAKLRRNDAAIGVLLKRRSYMNRKVFLILTTLNSQLKRCQGFFSQHTKISRKHR